MDWLLLSKEADWLLFSKEGKGLGEGEGEGEGKEKETLADRPLDFENRLHAH